MQIYWGKAVSLRPYCDHSEGLVQVQVLTQVDTQRNMTHVICHSNEKKILGTSVCADISQYALRNQYIQFLYETITQQVFLMKTSGFFCRFLDQICLQKTVFWTKIYEIFFLQSNI